MRKGWIESTLGDVAEWFSGGTPRVGKSEFYEGGKIPWVVISDLMRTEIYETATNITEAGLSEIGGRLAPVGSVLISMYATVGRPGITHVPVATNQAIAWSIPNTELVQPRFLLLVAQSLEGKISSMARGATQRNINRAMLREFTFLLPPIGEQKRIVDLVSSVDAYIDALQQQAEVAREARNAVLHELLESVADSPKKKLRELTSKIGSGATPRGGEAVYRESGTTLIRSQNVHDAKLLPEGLVAIDEIAAAALEGVSVQADDVLINITGASVARACLVDKTVLPARVNQHVAILRVKEDVLVAGYLLQFLLGKNMKSHLLDVAGSGTTRQAITKAQLESLEISVPSIEQQIQIVEVVSSMNEVIQSTEQAVSDAKSLRSGLLSNLLSGEHEIPESYDKVLGAA